MKNLLKQTILGLLYIAWHLGLKKEQPVIVALMYHSVSNALWKFAVSPEVFERQIVYLKSQDFQAITPDDLYEWQNSRRTLSKKSVLITFDDGYKDLTHAASILHKHNMSATLFCHTNRSQELGNELPLLTWDEIKKLKESGIQIQDHSFSHPNLKDLNAEELSAEISHSKHLFQEHLSSQPSYFAYPGGKFNQQAIDLLKKSGYKGAYTIDRGLINKQDSPFRIKRFGVTRDTSWLEFKARLTPVNNWYEYIT
jgi:peptidoglycan/xylan/chitin deacetylase (PgdA/CDA1 family)